EGELRGAPLELELLRVHDRDDLTRLDVLAEAHGDALDAPRGKRSRRVLDDLGVAARRQRLQAAATALRQEPERSARDEDREGRGDAGARSSHDRLIAPIKAPMTNPASRA